MGCLGHRPTASLAGMQRMNSVLVGAAVLAALAGCTTPPPPREPIDNSRAGLPTDAINAARYRIDSTASDVEIRIFRGGRLARLGHNHVMTLPDLSGHIRLAPDLTASTAAMQFSVATIDVDAPARRTAAGEGFESVPSAKDIDGTRRNMLSASLLDGSNHPTIAIAVARIETLDVDAVGVDTPMTDGVFDVTLQADVKGQAFQFSAPATLRRDGERLSVTGDFVLRQSDLGLTPFSVMLGALQVEDEMQIRYRIVAVREDDS